MSEVTKTLRRRNYPAIDAESPDHSQSGRNVLITGGTAVIGHAAAQGFIAAGANVVAITSRSGERAALCAKELEDAGKGTKVIGYQYENADEASVNALWDSLKRDGIQIDVCVLNTTANVPNAEECELSTMRALKTIEI